MVYTFVSGLPQTLERLLRASSRIETMTLEQLLTRARAIITNNQKPEGLVTASVQRIYAEIPHSGMHKDSIICFKCSDSTLGQITRCAVHAV